jgi:hypothetical protein
MARDHLSGSIESLWPRAGAAAAKGLGRRRCVFRFEGSLVGGGREVHPVREEELSVPPQPRSA